MQGSSELPLKTLRFLQCRTLCIRPQGRYPCGTIACWCMPFSPDVKGVTPATPQTTTPPHCRRLACRRTCRSSSDDDFVSWVSEQYIAMVGTQLHAARGFASMD
eukprot:2868832-Amphidinium_carterae.3